MRITAICVGQRCLIDLLLFLFVCECVCVCVCTRWATACKPSHIVMLILFSTKRAEFKSLSAELYRSLQVFTYELDDRFDLSKTFLPFFFPYLVSHFFHIYGPLSINFKSSMMEESWVSGGHFHKNKDWIIKNPRLTKGRVSMAAFNWANNEKTKSAVMCGKLFVRKQSWSWWRIYWTLCWYTFKTPKEHLWLEWGEDFTV